MDERPTHDSRGLMISRALPKDRAKNDYVHVEFGEPQQYQMQGGIEKAEAIPGIFRMRFTEVGMRKMGGLRTVEIEFDKQASEVPEVLAAMDYIFDGFDGYTRWVQPNDSGSSQSGAQ